MTDDASTPFTAESTNAATGGSSSTAPGSPQGESSSSQVRLAILLVILVIMIGALAYDRLVARAGYNRAAQVLRQILEGGKDLPASPKSAIASAPKEFTQKAADKKSEERPSEKKAADSSKKAAHEGGSDTPIAPPLEEDDGTAPEEDAPKVTGTRVKARVYNRDDIRKALGRQPAVEGKAAEAPSKLPSRLLTTTDPKAWANRHGYWELYRWRSGVPFRFYELLVIYSGPNEPLFSNFIGGEPMGPDQFSGVAIPTFDPNTPSEPHAPVMADVGKGENATKKKGGRKKGAKGHTHGHGKKKAAGQADKKKDGDKK